MAGSYVGSLFSRMFSCAPRAPPERRYDLSNDDVVSEMSGVSEVLAEKPFANSKKCARVPGGPGEPDQSRPRRKKSGGEQDGRRRSSKLEGRRGAAEASSDEPQSKKRAGKSSKDKHGLGRDKRKQRREDSREAEEPPAGRKVRDLLAKQSKKRGSSCKRASASGCGDSSYKEEESERAISKGLESLLQHPPSKHSGDSGIRENNARTVRELKRAARSKMSSDKRQSRTGSASSTDDGDAHKGRAGKLSCRGRPSSDEEDAARDVQRVSPTSESVPANSAASTESLRNPALRQGFSASRPAESESTADIADEDGLSVERSSDNETDVSYMIDFYDKIHFNRILAKRMTNFLSRKKKK